MDLASSNSEPDVGWKESPLHPIPPEKPCPRADEPRVKAEEDMVVREEEEDHKRPAAETASGPTPSRPPASYVARTRVPSTSAAVSTAAASEDGKSDAVVKEAQGIRLQLSLSSTGYKGVHFTKSRRFEARIHHKYNVKYLGTFDTAVQAAVAYARAMAEAKSAEDAPRKRKRPKYHDAHSEADEDGGDADEKATASTPRASWAPPSLPTPPASSTPSALLAASFFEKLTLIKQQLGIAPSDPAPAAICQANALMGIAPQGALPVQLDCLIRGMFS